MTPYRRRVTALIFFLAVSIMSTSVPAVEYKVYDLPAPDYPEDCLRRGVEGVVLLELHIVPGGKIQNISVLQYPHGCPEFVTAAKKAVGRARFYSPPNGDRILDQRFTLPITFNIARD